MVLVVVVVVADVAVVAAVAAVVAPINFMHICYRLEARIAQWLKRLTCDHAVTW